MLVGLAASWAPLPYNAAAVIPLVWAGVESVLAIRASSSVPGPKRRIMSGVVGLVLATVLTSTVLLPYAVYGTAKRFQDCSTGANTAIAAAECDSQRKSDLQPFFGGFLDDSR
jgi:hypothetical protein